MVDSACLIFLVLQFFSFGTFLFQLFCDISWLPHSPHFMMVLLPSCRFCLGLFTWSLPPLPTFFQVSSTIHFHFFSLQTTALLTTFLSFQTRALWTSRHLQRTTKCPNLKTSNSTQPKDHTHCACPHLFLLLGSLCSWIDCEFLKVRIGV